MAAGPEHIQKEIRRALITCVPYFLIVFFLDDIDKFLYTIHSGLGNPLIALYLLIGSIIILSLIIHECMDIRENFKAFGYMAILPLCIYLVTVFNSSWSPISVSSNNFKSKIVYKAYRRGQFGHDQMRLRQNGNMDIRYSGAWGLSEWEYGHWWGKGDTFYLNYDHGKDSTFVKPDTLIMVPNGVLVPIGIPADTLALYKNVFFRIPVTKKQK